MRIGCAHMCHVTLVSVSPAHSSYLLVAIPCDQWPHCWCAAVSPPLGVVTSQVGAALSQRPQPVRCCCPCDGTRTLEIHILGGYLLAPLLVEHVVMARTPHVWVESSMPLDGIIDAAGWNHCTQSPREFIVPVFSKSCARPLLLLVACRRPPATRWRVKGESGVEDPPGPS